MDTTTNGRQVGAKSEAERPERGPDGRFVKGNKAGPGNSFARRVAAIRKALLDAVSEEDIAAIARKLVELARGGDVAAAKVLLAYTVGKPAQVVDPDALDVEEWRLVRQATAAGPEVSGLFQGVPLELALDMARAARPGIIQGMAKGIHEALTDEDEDGPEDENARDDDLAGAAFDRAWLDSVLHAAPSTNGRGGAGRKAGRKRPER